MKQFKRIAFIGAVILTTVALCIGFSDTGKLLAKDILYQLTQSDEKIELREISLSIPTKGIVELELSRQKALSKGFLAKEDRVWVDALVERQGSIDSVYARLKGRLSDHFQHEFKWSFRTKSRSPDIEYLSFQQPMSRGYYGEWVFRQFLLKQGFLVPSIEFVRMRVNGKDLGIYIAEEHSRNMLLNQPHKAGALAKYDEESYFEEVLNVGTERTLEGFITSWINGFKKAEIRTYVHRHLDDGESKEKYLKGLLDGFRQGSEVASEVFSINKMAELFAIKDLFGAHLHHPLWYHNLDFYFSPSDSMLYPINNDLSFVGLLDVNDIVGNKHNPFLKSKGWFTMFFDDPVFLKAYKESLAKMTDPKILDAFFLENEGDLESYRVLFGVYFPEYKLEKEWFYTNQQTIRKFLLNEELHYVP